MGGGHIFINDWEKEVSIQVATFTCHNVFRSVKTSKDSEELQRALTKLRERAP